MKLNINNVPQDNILIFDIEYDQNVLIQLATLTLRKIESDVFQLIRSTNIYIDPNQSVVASLWVIQILPMITYAIMELI